MILYKVFNYEDGLALINPESIIEITPVYGTSSYAHLRERHGLPQDTKFWEVGLSNKRFIVIDDQTAQLILKEAGIKIKDFTFGQV